MPHKYWIWRMCILLEKSLELRGSIIFPGPVHQGMILKILLNHLQKITCCILLPSLPFGDNHCVYQALVFNQPIGIMPGFEGDWLFARYELNHLIVRSRSGPFCPLTMYTPLVNSGWTETICLQLYYHTWKYVWKVIHPLLLAHTEKAF